MKLGLKNAPKYLKSEDVYNLYNRSGLLPINKESGKTHRNANVLNADISLRCKRHAS